MGILSALIELNRNGVETSLTRSAHALQIGVVERNSNGDCFSASAALGQFDDDQSLEQCLREIRRKFNERKPGLLNWRQENGHLKLLIEART
jgi:hypothetical protein